MKKGKQWYIPLLTDARGFEWIAGKHFDPTSTAAPVTNDTTIRIVLVLMLLADWMARMYDVKGAFLKGKFEDSEEIFMEVPQGIEHHYWGLAVPRILKPIYVLVKAVKDNEKYGAQMKHS